MNGISISDDKWLDQMAPEGARSCVNKWLMLVLYDVSLSGSDLTGWHQPRSDHFSLGVIAYTLNTVLSSPFHFY